MRINERETKGRNEARPPVPHGADEQSFLDNRQ
jgi:hypothetical protein